MVTKFCMRRVVQKGGRVGKAYRQKAMVYKGIEGYVWCVKN
jgi:hypothetical protein